MQEAFDKNPVLHPVFEKDYESHSVLSESWRHFDHELMDSYFLTIFWIQRT
jgi:hypothetical protein